MYRVRHLFLILHRQIRADVRIGVPYQYIADHGICQKHLAQTVHDAVV